MLTSWERWLSVTFLWWVASNSFVRFRSLRSGVIVPFITTTDSSELLDWDLEKLSFDKCVLFFAVIGVCDPLAVQYWEYLLYYSQLCVVRG